ncbi:YdcH family protein [Altererythrobacter arenosus]|uniref:YdcH family protein n=1 Tax=Altererythrobacter arenosus TaxID=3032592 RepID=A0ABY8FRX5_9SPHN|nr:YdcH family protein [Altererythrobacter sp. CAU 1644]WFL76835.1 YdcH family protein [Altererythrobacter sp. CAU 1644]
MTARMFKLTQIHQRIDERIRLEMRKLRPDWMELTRLKRMKLRAKDALYRLSQHRKPA